MTNQLPNSPARNSVIRYSNFLRISNFVFRISLLTSVLLAVHASPAPAAEDLQAREERALLAAVEHVAPSVVSIETVGGLERLGKVMLSTRPTTGVIISA